GVAGSAADAAEPEGPAVLQVLPEEQSPRWGGGRETAAAGDQPTWPSPGCGHHHHGAAHAQLRRLRNCSSSLLKEATVTCVAPHHSKVCFTFECPEWEKVREDDKMGFIMTECGVEGSSLRLVGHGSSGSHQAEALFSSAEGEPSCDALLLLEIKTVWFNFAAPPAPPMHTVPTSP
ncbi:uncharacterized protein LOC125756724, partial [Rhipicephalus sanguineus]|uniref:uncharacterized protein LOC125756724 n=1 Tax=Rhipicephalus sanguineus TaxID=34632 RepID=UPI0020C4C738